MEEEWMGMDRKEVGGEWNRKRGGGKLWSVCRINLKNDENNIVGNDPEHMMTLMHLLLVSSQNLYTR